MPEKYLPICSRTLFSTKIPLILFLHKILRKLQFLPKKKAVWYPVESSPFLPPFIRYYQYFHPIKNKNNNSRKS